jgi:2-hydroxychromene-2-carboxylate isomerase
MSYAVRRLSIMLFGGQNFQPMALSCAAFSKLGVVMTVAIDAYYDFRSPYAYFAAHRIRKGLFRSPIDVEWVWRPVSMNILLNLQAGRGPWDAYVDPLAPPKRAHLLADVRRCARFFDAPMRPLKPSRPDSVPALCVAAMLDSESHAIFRNAIFEALWEQQLDIADTNTLAMCLERAGKAHDVLTNAQSAEARTALKEQTEAAYATGVFGVPSFVFKDEVFFGNDRLEMLAWRLGQA